MKPTTKYFDATKGIVECKAVLGMEITPSQEQILSIMEPVLNRAYEDGFKDGMEAAHA